MVNMMRKRINFFRNCFDSEVLREKPPEVIAKAVGAMRTITMVPDSTMCTHDNHAVNEGCGKKVPVEELKDEHQKKRE